MGFSHTELYGTKILSCKTSQDDGNLLTKNFLKDFDRLVLLRTALTLFFCALAVAEIVLLIVFFPLLIQNAFFAFGLAAVLLTFFALLMVRQYYETERAQKIGFLVENFLSQCQNTIRDEDQVEKHIQLASSASKLANQIHGREFSYYKPPKWLNFLNPFLEKLSCYLHWKDLHALKELLLIASLEEYLKLVRKDPTSLEVHAALANAYVMLSGLYLDPRKMEGYDPEQWIPPGKYSDAMAEHFKWAAERAIEEFKILKEYAPNDPWVYTQLAYSYRDLKMPLEEMRAYEAIVKLRPSDHESLFKLGVLYFREGENALGLKVYQELKKAHFKKAEMLMSYYGTL